jgi:hypothetical protein
MILFSAHCRGSADRYQRLDQRLVFDLLAVSDEILSMCGQR